MHGSNTSFTAGKEEDLLLQKASPTPFYLWGAGAFPFKTEMLPRLGGGWPVACRRLCGEEGQEPGSSASTSGQEEEEEEGRSPLHGGGPDPAGLPRLFASPSSSSTPRLESRCPRGDLKGGAQHVAPFAAKAKPSRLAGLLACKPWVLRGALLPGRHRKKDCSLKDIHGHFVTTW